VLNTLSLSGCQRDGRPRLRANRLHHTDSLIAKPGLEHATPVALHLITELARLAASRNGIAPHHLTNICAEIG
jgi:hypothetical protein